MFGGSGDKLNVGGIIADLEVDSGKMEQGLARGRIAMEAVERELKQLDADLKRGALDVAEYNQRVQELTATQQQLAASMKTAYAAVQTTNGGLDIAQKSMADSTKAARNLGFAMMQVGAMADDAQYGVKNLVNNIGPLALGLSGGNMAVAGGAQIAAVAIYQLSQHIDDLKEAFAGGLPGDFRSELKEFAEMAERVAHGVGDVRKAIHEGAAREETNRALPSEDETKAAAEYKKAVANAGAGKVEAGIALSMPEAKLTKEEEDAARKAAWEGAGTFDRIMGNVDLVGGLNDNPHLPMGPTRAKLLAKEEETIAEAQRQKQLHMAGQLMDQAMGHGPNAVNARRQIAQMAQEHPELFPGTFAGDAQQLTPEAMADQKRFGVNVKRAEEQAKQDKIVQDANARRAKEEHTRMVRGLEEQDREAKAQEQAEEHERKANADRARAEHARMARQLDEQDRQAAEHERDVMGRVDDIPGMKKFAEGARLRERFGGGNALDQIKEALTKAGYSEDDANMAAHNLVTGADKSISGKVSGEMGKGDEEQRRSRNSEVFNTSDLAHKVQQAVGGENYEKKNVDQNEKMIQLLARIAEKEGFRPEGMG